MGHTDVNHATQLSRRQPAIGRRAACAAAAITLGFVLFAPPSSDAAPATADASLCFEDTPTDVDGGGPDIVVGMPSYDLPGKPDAGAIAIYSNVAGLSENDPSAPAARAVVTADDIEGLSAQAGARFGAAVAIWRDPTLWPDDDDDCADILVGAPGQNVGGSAGAGQVYSIEGSDDGLAGLLQTFDVASLDGSGSPQIGAGFGSSIAADSYTLLAIGEPGRDIAASVDAGRIVTLDYSSSLSDPSVGQVQQGPSGAGTAESGDRFGEVLEIMPTGEGPALFIGVPGEDVGSLVDAGAVALKPAKGQLSMLSQDSPGAGGVAEAGDRYGSSLDTYATYLDNIVIVLAIGAPGEDVGSLVDAGSVGFAVVDLFVSDDEPVSDIRGMAVTKTQNSPGVLGTAEAGDRFGASVLTAEFGQDNGQMQLVVGSPGEDLGSVRDAGSITRSPIEPDATPSAIGAASSWNQDSPGVAGVAEAGDRFGAAMESVLLAGPSDDDDSYWPIVLATTPGEDIGTVPNAGLPYLGYPPGTVSVALSPLTVQAGAGAGLAPASGGG